MYKEAHWLREVRWYHEVYAFVLIYNIGMEAFFMAKPIIHNRVRHSKDPKDGTDMKKEEEKH